MGGLQAAPVGATGAWSDLQLSTCRSQVDPLFRLPTTWRPPLSPLNHFLRRRGPVFSSVKPEYRQAPFGLNQSPYRSSASQLVLRVFVSLRALLDAKTALVLVSRSSLRFSPSRTTSEARSVWSGALSASPFLFAYARALTVSPYVIFQYVLISKYLRSALIERSAVRQARPAVIFAASTHLRRRAVPSYTHDRFVPLYHLLHPVPLFDGFATSDAPFFPQFWLLIPYHGGHFGTYAKPYGFLSAYVIPKPYDTL